MTRTGRRGPSTGAAETGAGTADAEDCSTRAISTGVVGPPCPKVSKAASEVVSRTAPASAKPKGLTVASSSARDRIWLTNTPACWEVPPSFARADRAGGRSLSWRTTVRGWAVVHVRHASASMRSRRRRWGSGRRPGLNGCVRSEASGEPAPVPMLLLHRWTKPHPRPHPARGRGARPEAGVRRRFVAIPAAQTLSTPTRLT